MFHRFSVQYLVVRSLKFKIFLAKKQVVFNRLWATACHPTNVHSPTILTVSYNTAGDPNNSCYFEYGDLVMAT